MNQMALRIQKALQLDDIQYSRLESGFSFSFACGAVLTGVVVDRVNVRWVYPVMVLGWSLAGMLTGYASSFAWLLVCRIALGLFESGNWPCGLRTTRTILRPEERSFGNSLFQSGTAVGAIVTPALVFYLIREAEQAGNAAPSESWRVPFRAIGVLGVGWIILWFLSVPGRILVRPPTTPNDPADGVARYCDVFKDRRFWALLAMTIGINFAWHTYRAWLPKYLQQKREFSEADMTLLTTCFYLVADIGSWSVGLFTLLIMRAGCPGHTTRVLAYTGCCGLALVSFAVPFLPAQWQFQAAVLVFGFGALGLFPTYFAMSQEVSARHQGKVTGTLGFGAHMSLSLVMFPTQGYIIKSTGSYDEVLAAAGFFPLAALAITLWLWPLGSPSDRASPTT
jgi:ACS family hexuronate transporter-like MFS transporter